MKTIWKIHEANTRLQEILCKALGVTPVLAQILVNRDVRTPEDAHDFLYGGLDDCHDPFLMKDMEKAVTRIKKALSSKEKILIYGDYDVDGVTSTALLARVFDEMDIDYETFIPNRLEDGYGLNIRAVAKAREDGVKLLVTVDCGINSVKEIESANKHGIDVIITDHHEVKENERPDAYAIIDPHQKDCQYPFKYLAGVGVAYKLARALMKGNEDVADRFLDFVALGTIADVAPMNGENRILTKIGLRQLRSAKNVGLKALMEVGKIEPEKLTCRHIGFVLGPRINAMGRVGAANVALELLMCNNESETRGIANVLDKENRNRQAIEREILKQAISKVEAMDLEGQHAIVLADEAWHPGVIGIVASRIVEQYNLPAILIAIDGDKGKGSGRSVAGFNLFEALTRSGEHLADFGGHAAACGVRIETKNIDAFRESLNEAAKQILSETDIEEIIPELKIDCNLPFSHVGVKVIEELKMLMPYGPSNAEPVFATSALKVKNRPREIGRNGFKFLATCGSLTCEAITFRKNKVHKPSQGDMINLAYTPSINSWNGYDSIQLNIRDLQIAE